MVVGRRICYSCNVCVSIFTYRSSTVGIPEEFVQGALELRLRGDPAARQETHRSAGTRHWERSEPAVSAEDVLCALNISWLSCLVLEAICCAFRRRSGGGRAAVRLCSWAVSARSDRVAVNGPPKRSESTRRGGQRVPAEAVNCVPTSGSGLQGKAGSAGKRAAGGCLGRRVLCAGCEPACPMARRKSAYACSMRSRALAEICDIKNAPVHR